MKRLALMGVSLLSIVSLVACSTSEKSEKITNQTNTVKVPETTTTTVEEGTVTALDVWNKLSTHSVSTDELYVTGELVVGEKGDVRPGIYDLQVTGGRGNIMGDRALTTSGMFINWLGGAVDSGSRDYPSIIRIVLFEGDTLKLSDISKVKFTAIPQEVIPSNELGTGNYIVGRDIKAGTYKLSTNGVLNPDFENLGWSIDILNIEKGESRNQELTSGNSDVVVKLEDGELITTSFDNTDYDSSSDDIKLIFTEFSN